MAKKKFWSSDKIVAFVAMGISLITLIIFVKQTNIIEEQSHLSVMPYLMVETSDNGHDAVFHIEVVNYGVGPAIIDGKTFVYKDQTYDDMELVDFMRQANSLMDSVEVTNVSSLQNGLAIPSGGSRTLIRTGGTKDSYINFLQVMQEIGGDSLYYEIRYRSIYGDRWKITSLNEIPEAID